MDQYWLNAVSYEQYLKDNEAKINELEQSTAEGDQNYLEYYKLGLTRMKRVDKTYKPQEDLEKIAETKHFKGKFLIISEGWCGDAAMIIPVIHRFFENKNEVKISYRDQSDLIDNFLTNGARSIPIVIILDEHDKVIHHWGPRPNFGMELLRKYKRNPEEYTADDFHNDLQVYYSKNKGKDIIEELLNLI